MTNVLEGLCMLHVVLHQAMLLGRGVGVAWRCALVVLVFIVLVLLSHEIFRAFVLVCAAILRNLSVQLH